MSAPSLDLDLATELPQEKLIRQLCNTLRSYLEPDQIEEVHRAYRFADQAHQGQTRVSGEPYICHPIAVAALLAEMRMDSRGLMAAILHDVIEDTGVSKEQLSHQFGPEVAELVDGVTKLTQLDCKSRLEAQAQNVRKMFMAMTKDLRVIMVKLADRLHNMRTLGVMAPERKRRIARETLEIYAPVANRLGMNQIRHELEDLGFGALHPLRYRLLNKAVKEARGHRKDVISNILNALQRRLDENHIPCQIIGREKHLYGIYQKMRGKRVSFDGVLDVYAFRILTDNVDSCYRVLGIVHNLYKPLPGRFKDYIALPKANGYQSLHTVLKSPYGPPVEIQIRTHSMHRMAEVGIAAHWLYKSDNDSLSTTQARAHEWLRDLLEIQKSAGDSLEFLDNLKVDLFQQEIYVFTPQSEIIKLPRGATLVDFAYAVHTGIGNACISGKINGRLVPLQTPLQNGQTVEIITAPWARPSPFWLKYVVTAKARASIRAYLRNLKKQEAIALGKRLLDNELNQLGTHIDALPKDHLTEIMQALGVPDLEHLYEDLGLGNRLPLVTARCLLRREIMPATANKAKSRTTEKDTAVAPLIIKGTEGVVVSLARCCHPIPGDSIVGFFNPGKGLVIHLRDCKNVLTARKKQVNWLDVEWHAQAQGEYSVELRVVLHNQRGALAMIASAISKAGGNIENVQVSRQDENTAVDLITLNVKDRVHLAQIMRELRKLTVVMKIVRDTT